jgi:putative membrane protein
MAAVRTSVSLIGFGFTVAQFFQRLQNDAPAGTGHMGPEMPRNFGLVLIGVGVISLAIFTWQYRVVSNHFRTGQYSVIATDAEATHLSTTLTAYAVMLIGVAAFGSVFVRF